MQLTNLEVFNFKGAFRGMRNPMNSWEKSDSDFIYNTELLGPNDIKLAQKLIKAGNEHRKFLRQILVSFDLTAPLYFWKEFDTYKIGTVSNSTSTMHKLASTPITLDCFEVENLDLTAEKIKADLYLNQDDEKPVYNLDTLWKVSDIWDGIIEECENLRLLFLKTKDKKYWKALIQMLPESWLQTRTITMNYENVLSIIHQRHNHKLSEWNWLVKQFKELPYAYELLFFTLEEKTNEIN